MKLRHVFPPLALSGLLLCSFAACSRDTQPFHADTEPSLLEEMPECPRKGKYDHSEAKNTYWKLVHRAADGDLTEQEVKDYLYDLPYNTAVDMAMDNPANFDGRFEPGETWRHAAADGVLFAWGRFEKSPLSADIKLTLLEFVRAETCVYDPYDSRLAIWSDTVEMDLLKIGAGDIDFLRKLPVNWDGQYTFKTPFFGPETTMQSILENARDKETLALALEKLPVTDEILADALHSDTGMIFLEYAAENRPDLLNRQKAYDILNRMAEYSDYTCSAQERAAFLMERFEPSKQERNDLFVLAAENASLGVMNAFLQYDRPQKAVIWQAMKAIEQSQEFQWSRVPDKKYATIDALLVHIEAEEEPTPDFMSF